MVTAAALDELNQRLEAPVPMSRFRPNLVVAGAPAHAEDGWRRVRVGEVELELVKPCARCVATTIDMDAGAPAGPEPLRTLATYRRGPRGLVRFGQNAVPRGEGVLRPGDPVVVLA